MRVLLVSHYFPPRHRSGVENYTHRLARALGTRHDVRVLCREDGHWGERLRAEDETYDGVAVHRLYYNGPLDFRRCYRNEELDRPFESFLRRFRPDVVHFQHLERLSAGFVDVAGRLGRPTVLTLNDFWFACPQIQLYRDGRVCPGPDEGRRCASCAGALPEALRLQALEAARARWDASLPRRALRVAAARLAPEALRERALVAVLRRAQRSLGVSEAEARARLADLREVLSRVDLVLSPSRFLLRTMEELGFAPRAAEYSDYGIPELGPRPARAAPRARIRFGYFSALVPHKGIELLLRAFHRLGRAEAELVVQGQAAPHYEDELRRRTARDARIELRPPYDDLGLAAAFADIDVLVVPSLWYENSPLVIHEAARAGVPVVASDLGGMAEYVRSGVNGELFRAGDERDLARVLRLFVDEPARAGRLREAPFPLKSMAEDAAALEERYERLVRRAAGASA
ncbi:MAG: glycosyltransferase family 4 protein [Vicinamibacteria bacterium]